MDAIEELKDQLNCKIITRTSDNFIDACLNWNPFTSQTPCCIVYPLTEDAIIQCINWCIKNEVKFRVRGKHSHSLGYDFSSITNGLVCNVENFNTIKYALPEYTQGFNKVIVGSGCVIGDLAYKLAADGYMFPFGDSYGVGIAGIIQGGGIGLQNKQMGLCCDNLLECKIISSDGKILEVNNNKNNDLLWALKGGGGGNFGVITELTLNCIQAPKTVTYISMEWSNIDINTIHEIVVEWLHTNNYNNINICRSLSTIKQTNNDLFSADIKCIIYNNDLTLFKFKDIGNYIKNIFTIPYLDAVKAELESTKNEIHCDVNIQFLGYFCDTILDDATIDLIVDYFSKNDSDLYFLEMGGNFHKNETETAFYWRSSILYFELSIIWPVFKFDTLVYNKKNRHSVSKSSTNKNNKLHKPNFILYEQVAKILEKKYKTGYINVPNNTYKTPSKYEQAYYGNNITKLKEIKCKYDQNNFFNFSQSIKDT